MKPERKVILGCAFLSIAIPVAGLALFFFLAGVRSGVKEHSQKKAALDAGPPDMSEKGLYRPEFLLKNGSFAAGTAFLAFDGAHNEMVMLSAHHLLGPAGGLEEEIPWDLVASELSGIVLKSINREHRNIFVEDILTIEGAQAMGETLHNDLLAARLPGGISRERLIPLRKDRPLVGEPVWLYAKVINGGGLMHRAIVVDNKALEYKFDNHIELRATSGAPVVDYMGRLVAINLGAYTDKDNNGKQAVYGLGISTPSIRSHLILAFKRSDPK